MKNIQVIGSGVNGLGSAYCLAKRFPDCDITITSANDEVGNVSYHGFGVVVARTVEMLENEDERDYIRATRDYCQNLSLKQEAEEAGIRIRESFNLINMNKPKETKDGVANIINTGYGVRRATKEEMQEAGLTAKNKDLKVVLEDENLSDESLQGYIGQHYVIDTSVYLPWLKKKLQEMTKTDGKTSKVRFVNKKLSRLNDLEPCDLIINRSGVGAAELGNDRLVIPIRGQYLIMDCPEMKRAFIADHTVLAPRMTDVSIGGVYQSGRSDKGVIIEDTKDILRRAEAVCPALKGKNIRKIDVGIRPGRIGGPRIEIELIDSKNRPKKIPIIHNYGHGRSGIGQHWGCSLKVADLAAKVFSQRSNL